MEVEVYADLLFLVNAGMDGLCFGLTGRLLHRRLSRLRMAAAAMIGGLYGVVSLFLEVGALLAPGVDLAVCFLMCGIVFTGRSAGRGGFLSAVATYFSLSMVLGGVMTALYHLLNRLEFSRLLQGAAGDSEGPGVWLFALLALGGSVLTLKGGQALRRRAIASGDRVSVTLYLNRREVVLDGMVDTGNLLRDPTSGRPVICADRAALAPVLPPHLAEALSGEGAEALSHTECAHRLRVIPVGTATGQGLLVGFLPDGVELRYIRDGRRPREVCCRPDAVIALTDLGDVSALVPSVLLTA